MDNIVWYLQRAKESDIRTRHFPLWEDLPERYPDMASAMKAADDKNAANDGYRYESDFYRI